MIGVPREHAREPGEPAAGGLATHHAMLHYNMNCICGSLLVPSLPKSKQITEL